MIDLSMIHVGSIIGLHHGIEGVWQVVDVGSHSCFGQAITVRRIDAEGRGSVVPASYLKDIIS